MLSRPRTSAAMQSRQVVGCFLLPEQFRGYTTALHGEVRSGLFFAGIAQLVELQPSKLDVVSSSLIARSMHRYQRGQMARPAKPLFAGSNPALCSIHSNPSSSSKHIVVIAALINALRTMRRSLRRAHLSFVSFCSVI